MKLYTINTEFFKLDGGAMFGVVPKSIWSKFHPADEKNLCNWAMRCLLIEEGNKLILIDNGIGNKMDPKLLSFYYLNGEDTLDSSLNKLGFGKDDITDVVLTHLHFDHCGGSIVREGDKLLPAFKNAIYWSNENHWQWATHPNDREKASFFKENILPIKEGGQLQFISAGSNNSSLDENGLLKKVQSFIIPQLSFRIVNGHTNAMMLPQIEHNGSTLVFVADLLPSVAHIPVNYVTGYDVFPLTTMEEKKSFLKESVANNYTLFFEHDPFYECCTLQTTEKGIRQKDTFKLIER